VWSTVGQDHLLNQIDAGLRAGRLAHAYLMSGPPHVGKMTLALDLAAAVNCAVVAGKQSGSMFADPDATEGPCGHCDPCMRIRRGVFADLKIIAVGGDARVATRISIDQVREAESFLAVTPVEGSWKVVIFDGAETLSAGQSEPANALLKTLEEPPAHVLVLLLTTNEDAILPTIRSRCRTLPLRPMSGGSLSEYLVSERGMEPDAAGRLARLARGCPGWAINVLDDPERLDAYREQLARISAVGSSPLDARFNYANTLAQNFSGDRESVRQELYLWERWWRDVLLAKEGLVEHVHNDDRHEELTAQADATTTGDIVVFLESIHETLGALDANVNPRLALECMMLAVPLGLT
jgi:DNA polymerase-3 subunit delta'